MIILFTTTGYRELERVSLTHKNNNNNIKNMFSSTNYKAEQPTGPKFKRRQVHARRKVT